MVRTLHQDHLTASTTIGVHISNQQDLGTNESRKVKTLNFVRTLRGSSNSQVRLYIPKELALQNGLTNGELILKDMKNEGAWTINISNYLGKFYYIHTGLNEFCIANGLKKGDHVKFELIRSGRKPIAIFPIYKVASVQSLRTACYSVKL
ncbi:putative transcription factor B3-Domain family [Helianthus annuus]|nr:putative transcription factor B3-Domain family [Helianthus annuus]